MGWMAPLRHRGAKLLADANQQQTAQAFRRSGRLLMWASGVKNRIVAVRRTWGSVMGRNVYLEPLEHAVQNPLILGLFLPLQSGAWSPSTAPRSTSWTFD